MIEMLLMIMFVSYSSRSPQLAQFDNFVEDEEETEEEEEEVGEMEEEGKDHESGNGSASDSCTGILTHEILGTSGSQQVDACSTPDAACQHGGHICQPEFVKYFR